MSRWNRSGEASGKSGKGMPRPFKCECGKTYAMEHSYSLHVRLCKDRRKIREEE